MAVYSLSEEKLEELAFRVKDFIDKNQLTEAKSCLGDLQPGELAQIIHYLPPALREFLMVHLWDDLDGKVLNYLDKSVLSELTPCLSPKKLAHAVQQLESDDAFSLLDDLPDDITVKVLSELSAANKKRFEAAQNFPLNSAGRLMQQEILAVPHHWTIKETRRYLAAYTEKTASFYMLFLVDKDWQLRGAIWLEKIIGAPESTPLLDMARQDLCIINAADNQEDVVLSFKRHALLAAPVIDHNNKLVGLITADDVISALDKEAEEDIMHLGGVVESDFYAPIITTTAARFQWLLITFFNTLLASAVLSQFQMVLEKKVALAVLMPIVAAMGGNAGTQVVTVVVRAIATHNLGSLNMGRTLLKASAVSLLNGLIFAIILSAITALWFQDVWLALTLGAALLINMFWAGIGGTALPILVSQMGLDPALSAGPILTTTTDVLGFAVFLGLAKLILF